MKTTAGTKFNGLFGRGNKGREAAGRFLEANAADAKLQSCAQDFDDAGYWARATELAKG